MYSTQHLIKCLIQKQKYKQTSQYIKQLQLQNQIVCSYINDALYNILSGNNNPVTSKLFALRFFKDIFMTAQFHVIDGLNDAIIKQIVKAAQFDKDNKDKMKRGYNYFQQVQKRKKQNDIEKVSYSYVLFSTQIIYVMGNWYQIDQNQQKTDYFLIYQKLKKSGVPFPINDKQLKFFKIQQRQTFNKNLKQWVAKLPQIQQQSQNQQNEKQKQKQKNKLQKDQSTNKQVSKKLLSQKNINSSSNPINQKSTKKSAPKDQLKQNKNILQLTQQLKQQNIKLKTDLNNQKLKIFQFQQKIKVLQTESSQRLKQINQLKSKNINTNNDQLKILKQKCQSFKVQNQKLKLSLTDKQRQVQKLSNDKKNIQTQLKNKLQQNHKTILTKQQQIAKLKTQFQIKKNQLNQSKKKLNQVQKKLKGQISPHLLGYDIPKQQQKQKVTQNLIKSLEKQNSQMKSQINKLQVQQNSLKLKIDSLNVQNNKLIGQNKQLQKKIQLQVKNIKQIQAKNIIQVQKIKQSCQRQISIIAKLQPQQPIQNKKTLKKKAIQKRQSQTTHKPIIIQQKCESTTFNVQKQSSMSEYLKLRQSKAKQFNPRESLRNNFFQQETSVKNSKFKQLIQNTKDDLRKSLTNIKTKNNSLGKTQCSKQKLKNRRQVQSSRKSCHYNSNEYETNSQQYNKVQLVRHTTFHRKTHTSSYTNLFSSNQNTAYKSMPSNLLSKKSSMLHLNYKQNQHFHKLSTIIPKINNYFQFKQQYMTNKDNFYFRNLCLISYKRQNYPVFVDNVIQIKLLNHRNKDTFTLEINNIGCNSLKIKANCSHDQFKIVGDRNRYVQPKMTVEYRIQTHVKDLNLRYPIISLSVVQQNKLKNSIRQQQLKYNIPLPLTLLQFTQFQNKIPAQFYSHQQQYKNYRSEQFNINPKHQSLIKCFKYLKFQKNQTNNFYGKHNQIYWQGTLRHSFIQNVEIITKFQQSGTKVNIDLSFKQYDKISENYAKVIIQVLMFLLQ